MYIKSISFKNFGSYGNKLITLDFDKDFKNNLCLVYGSNGAGKSTLANIIIFGLYGKIDGVNLSELPNRINKNLYVKINVEVNNKDVIIERGISPKLFKVYINNNLLDLANKNELEDILENDILKIPYNVFKNIIILSINDFKSFLFLNTKDKRNILYKIFNIDEIHHIYEQIKEKYTSIFQENNNINTVYNNNLKILESFTTNNIKTNGIEDLLQKRDKYISNLEQQKEEYTKLNLKLDDINKKITKADKNLFILNNEVKLYTKKLALYNNNICYECEKPLDTDFDVKRKIHLNEYLNNLKEKITQVNDIILKLQQHKNNITQKIKEVNNTISILNNTIIEIDKDIESNKKYNSVLNLENNIKEQNKKYLEEIQTNEVYLKQLSVLLNIFSDTGIKKVIIDYFLPEINNYINYYSIKLDFIYKIKITPTFDIILLYKNDEIDATTLSSGERKKADFIIIMSLLKFIKSKFPNLNIIFLDEIFASIDNEGINNILYILKDLIKELNLNIFLINHHSNLNEVIFDKKVKVNKNIFSSIEIETIK